MTTIEAVVFDLDGVLVHTEEVWDRVREAFTREVGGRWPPEAQARMMGMSSPEWSRYMAEDLGVPFPPEQVSALVVERMQAAYREALPLVPGAVEAVARMAERWPLAIASSSNRELIDLVVKVAGVAGHFAASVSSEEVARGKPSPDVYLEAARRLGVPSGRCAAVEDSSNGLRAAMAAGMLVVAVPNPTYPPAPDVLAAAGLVLHDIAELTPAAVDTAAGRWPGAPAAK